MSIYKEAILYFRDKLETGFGVQKLQKLLFFAEAYYSMKTFESLFNKKFVRIPRGPVIDGYRIDLDNFNGDIITLTEKQIQGLNNPQQEYENLRGYDQSVFDADMIEALDKSIDLLRDKSGFQAGSLCYKKYSWLKNMSPGEEIPISFLIASGEDFNDYNDYEDDENENIIDQAILNHPAYKDAIN